MSGRTQVDKAASDRGIDATTSSRSIAPGKSSRVSELASAPALSAGAPAQTGNHAVPASSGRQLSDLFRGAGELTGKVPGQGAEILTAAAGKDDPEEPAAQPQLRMASSFIRSNSGGVVSGHPLTGLGKTTISGPTGLKSGSFSWVIQWVLDAPSPKGGCVVQGVETVFDVKDATGTKVDVKTKTGVNPANWPLWELWEINKGQKVTTYAEGGDTADDTYGMPTMGANTKGSIQIKGTAEFYEGLAKPSSFKATPGSPAGILPIVRSKPTLAGGTGPISHHLTATWDSTSGDETTTIAVV